MVEEEVEKEREVVVVVVVVEEEEGVTLEGKIGCLSCAKQFVMIMFLCLSNFILQQQQQRLFQ